MAGLKNLAEMTSTYLSSTVRLFFGTQKEKIEMKGDSVKMRECIKGLDSRDTTAKTCE
jgi:hypothetical protein